MMKTFLGAGLLLLVAWAPRRACAQQKEALPDLVVVAVQTVPEAPLAGDRVRLRAVVKNAGDAPTPMGTIIGGVFRLNGALVAYTDSYTFAIAPGETATLNASGGGGAGDGTWTAKAGKYSLSFLVDDVNRIRESGENNNDFTSPNPLEVRAFQGPDLVVSRVTWTQSADKTTFRAVIKNVGNGPTAPGTGIEARFSLDSVPVALARSAMPPGAGAKPATSLKAGQSTQIVASVPRVSDGQHQVTVLFDPRGLFAASERRRDNNELRRDLWQNQPLQVRATSSDAFADSIGVCTHLTYFDTAYGRYDLIKARLLESRIRWIRDGATTGNTTAIERILDLGKLGIKTDLLIDARSTPPAEALALIKRLKPALGSVEGQNEPNLFTPELYPDGIRAHQNGLFAALKADPETARIPVLSPALAFPGEVAKKLGVVSCDFGAMHPYPGGNLPDAGLDDTLRATRIIAPTQPLQSTETGYTTAVNVQSGQPGVSEAAQAKYLPRQLFEAWNRGVVRTFFYEFSDEKPEPALQDAEQHFGILRADGTPKPAFFALENLIALFGESPGSGLVARPGTLNILGAPRERNDLSLSASGDASDLRSALLGRRDGRRFLVLWRNARSFDLDTRTDVVVSPARLTVTLPQAAPVTLYRLTSSARPLGQMRRMKTVPLDLDDELTVIELGS